MSVSLELFGFNVVQQRPFYIRFLFNNNIPNFPNFVLLDIHSDKGLTHYIKLVLLVCHLHKQMGTK